MEDKKIENCTICNKPLRVPPNELVVAGKTTHTLCSMQFNAEEVFILFGELQHMITKYEAECKKSTAQYPVRHDMYMEQVEMLVKRTHNRTAANNRD